jgi:hypothetical protein
LLVVDVSAEFAKMFQLEAGKLRNEELFFTNYVPPFPSVLTNPSVLTALGENRESPQIDIKIESQSKEEIVNMRCSVKYTPHLHKQYYSVYVYRDNSYNYMSELKLNVPDSKGGQEGGVSIKVSGVRYGTNTKENHEDTDDSESYQENSSATEEKDETQSAGGSSRSSQSSNLVRIGIEKFNAQMEPVLKRLVGICFLTIVTLSAASIALNVIWAMESVGRFTITHDTLSSISQVEWGIISCEYASTIFK